MRLARFIPNRFGTRPPAARPVATLLLALAATAAAIAPASAADAEFRSDLGEVEDLLVREALDPNAASVPANAPELTRYPVARERPAELLDELPGRPMHDLSNPPLARAWWKYPVYAVVGAPRDAVDTVFGAFAPIPIVNLVVVGLAYEVVPTQLLTRDPRDWHRWPGRRNANGHGWIDGSSWGWFPTWRSMKFTYPSEEKLAALKAENAKLAATLQTRNAEIEKRNRDLARQRQDARRAAAEAIDAGKGEEAVARMLPLAQASPGDDNVQALLVNALALHGDGGPSWVRPYLWRTTSSLGLRALRRAETLLAATAAEFPASRTPAEALVFARTRLGDPEGALEAARTASRARPNDPAAARLYFEAAMAARDAEAAFASLILLDSTPNAGAPMELLRARLALLDGRVPEARQSLAALVAADPADPYARYYLGLADLELLEFADSPGAAVRESIAELERVALTSGALPLRERAERALSFARGLVPPDPDAPAATASAEEEEDEGGLF